MVGQVSAAGAALASASALPAAVFGPSGAEVLGSRNHAGPIPGALPGDILERVALGHQQWRYNPTEHANSQELHWPRSMGKCQWAAAQLEVFQNSKQGVIMPPHATASSCADTSRRLFRRPSS